MSLSGNVGSGTHPLSLNDDEALELFRKKLPGVAASFVQLKESAVTVHGKKIEMSKVFAMVWTRWLRC